MNTSTRLFSISDEQLLADLYVAYREARKNKRRRMYQLEFEFKLEDEIVTLRDELISGEYRPGRSSCFIIHEPKMREVFAAEFRDRIVHHLLYNYTHRLFERTFIYDSYSCIEGRGTHFGIERLRHHIRSESAGYSRPCYVLKVDISGYFMSINRPILLELCRRTLWKYRHELIDSEFIDYLLKVIINANPVDNCLVKGRESDWALLPATKSLFCSATDCGLPIGNLSSQLFSNVYLNVLDQYAKRDLGCRHYGRYVDDAYVVSGNRKYLESIIPRMSSFVSDRLGLKMNPDKCRIWNAYQGVEFLGAFIKPFRTYVSNSTLKRMRRRVLDREYLLSPASYLSSSVNSYLGVLSHYDSYCLRRVLFGYESGLNSRGSFDKLWLAYRCWF